MVIADGGSANRSQGSNCRKQQVTLGLLEFLTCLELVIEREHFRPLGKCFYNQAVDVIRRNSRLLLVLNQDEIMLCGKTEDGGKIRESGLVIVLRVEQ